MLVVPILDSEFIFHTSRSGGSGGQHVNKVSSKVELLFDIQNSQLLSTEQKDTLQRKLYSKISKDGILRVVAQTDRSQYKNKETAVKKFYEIIVNAFKEKKKRKPTKPSKISKQKRIDTKKKKGEIKKLRGRIFR